MTPWKKISNFVLDILQTVVLALSIFMLVYLFGAQPHEVSGNSMVPSFVDGEYLLTDKFSYRLGGAKRGDVIVFAAPTARQDFIKRIIGLPGETVYVQAGAVYVGGRPLEESYLPQDFTTFPGVYMAEGETITLGPQEYLVFGDNRDHSLDSRAFGPIKKDDIVGRAWIVYWPPGKAGVVPTVTYAGF